MESMELVVPVGVTFPPVVRCISLGTPVLSSWLSEAGLPEPSDPRQPRQEYINRRALATDDCKVYTIQISPDSPLPPISWADVSGNELSEVYSANTGNYKHSRRNDSHILTDNSSVMECGDVDSSSSLNGVVDDGEVDKFTVQQRDEVKEDFWKFSESPVRGEHNT